MKRLILAILMLLLTLSSSARDEVNTADLVIEASSLHQEATALCKKGEYDQAIKQFEEAIDAYNRAVKAYKKAKDKKSAANLKEKIKTIKEERDECKKKRKEAEDAADDPAEGEESADG